MARQTRKHGIVPFTKTHPDQIAETANLEDYEKMAVKMAMSSDEIIDRALDKMEKHGVAPQKSAANPPEDSSSKPEDPKSTTEKTEPCDFSKDADSDEHLPAPHVETQPAADDKDRRIAELEDGVARFADKLNTAQQTILVQRNSFNEEIEKLSRKNDDLLLRNSELEFEISRLGAENLRLKKEVELLRAEKILPPQTNTKEAYTRPPAPSAQVRRGAQVFPEMGRLRPPRRGMNGYESWN